MKFPTLLALLALPIFAQAAERESTVSDMKDELQARKNKGFDIVSFHHRGSLGQYASLADVISDSEVRCVRKQLEELDKAGLEKHGLVLVNLQTNRHSSILEKLPTSSNYLIIKLSVQHSLAGNCGLLYANQIQQMIQKIIDPDPRSASGINKEFQRNNDDKISYEFTLNKDGFFADQNTILSELQISCARRQLAEMKKVNLRKFGKTAVTIHLSEFRKNIVAHPGRVVLTDRNSLLIMPGFAPYTGCLLHNADAIEKQMNDEIATGWQDSSNRYATEEDKSEETSQSAQ
jgi:hypothetical protein